MGKKHWNKVEIENLKSELKGANVANQSLNSENMRLKRELAKARQPHKTTIKKVSGLDVGKKITTLKKFPEPASLGKKVVKKAVKKVVKKAAKRSVKK